MQSKEEKETVASEDRLSSLPEAIILDILSLLPERKEIVRSSVLSKAWRFLWKSVPLSLVFRSEIMSSVTRELQYWRSCPNIRTIKFYVSHYGKEWVEDIDLWVHFATKVANVESFSLALPIVTTDNEPPYEFPQYTYDNSSWKNLKLGHCALNPSGNVNWSHLLSLSLTFLNLTEAVMEKVLSGCPNLECLKLSGFWGIHRLEINSKKLRKLILRNYYSCMKGRLEILARYVQYLELVGVLFFILRNGDSLVTVVLNVRPERDRGLGYREDRWKMFSYFKELLQSVAHVENVEFRFWSIQFLSVMELKGWQSPSSNWKFLKLTTTLQEVNFSGICYLLGVSLDLETLDIDCHDYEDLKIISYFTCKDEQSRWVQSYSLKCSLLHLRTIQVRGPLNANKFVLPLVQYLLKNAKVVEKLFIAHRYKGSYPSEYYRKMEEEVLSFPRSSPHASVVFKCL